MSMDLVQTLPQVGVHRQPTSGLVCGRPIRERDEQTYDARRAGWSRRWASGLAAWMWRRARRRERPRNGRLLAARARRDGPLVVVAGRPGDAVRAARRSGWGDDGAARSV